jgi:hypothetical protein
MLLRVGAGAKLLRAVGVAAFGESAHATRVNPNLCVLVLIV